ncbi:MAG: hypothetical protein A4E29_01423 [Methanomassiliicoccales archaeon PtaB.Bin134]|nr:MAG: hypothetical protein A4E29_01423 [Methanomassiliicoccales archaeon PtaB.Bin134]
MDLTPAWSYMALFFSPTPPGVQSTITSTFLSRSSRVPCTLNPALSKLSRSSACAAYSGQFSLRAVEAS